MMDHQRRRAQGGGGRAVGEGHAPSEARGGTAQLRRSRQLRVISSQVGCVWRTRELCAGLHAADFVAPARTFWANFPSRGPLSGS